KARNLRNRLRTYTRAGGSPDAKLSILRSRLASFDTIVTESETEALVLESNLIKEHRPRYNVKLRDDKRYPFIKITTAEEFPRAYVTRLVRQDGSRYFGPYTDAKAMRRTLKFVRQSFPLRTCKAFKRRPRPCLNYQIGRCLGPCIGAVTPDEYCEVVTQLSLFLTGRAEELTQRLTARMQRASKERRFEEAAALRDRLSDIATVTQRQRVLTAKDIDQDVVAIARHTHYGVASIVRVRHGKLVGCENIPLEFAPETSDREIRESLLTQFYAVATDVPQEVLVSGDTPGFDGLAEWLTDAHGHRVHFSTPVRGEKRLLTQFAEQNAQTALRRAFEGRRAPKAVAELGELLRMNRPARLLSAVDISNIQGEHAVGTVISFRDGRPDTSLYRRYRIRTVKGPDDYGMIQEVVRRHFASIIKDGAKLPDLFLVDGGKGQLSAALAAGRAAGVRGVTFASLAKKNEEVFVPGRASPLPEAGFRAAKRILLRARDEVHRFSVTYHRALRQREARRSLLDGIPGIGDIRKVALLEKFGSVTAIQASSNEKIAEVPGIGIATARRIRKALSEAQSRHRQAGE
ncbi:excinuclease ABC subunit UvrC, partial [bacterium]|nr:excinuclease ABC subunit UvrC [bacterium]